MNDQVLRFLEPDSKDQMMAQCADAVDFLNSLPSDSVDLVMGSPPYSGKGARYGPCSKNLKGKDWARWMVLVFQGCVRVCKGLTAFVVDSGHKDARWDPAIAHLQSFLDDAGLHQFKPCIYHRNGITGAIPGWFKNTYESIVCVHRPGQLPWHDVMAVAKPPRYGPGGPISHRQEDGNRVKKKPYKQPTLALPGNFFSGSVGGGHMGHDLAHECEAAMPLWLVEPFVRCFARPAGVVLDPFMGSGTTGHAALLHGRRFLGCDNRPKMVDVTVRRLTDVLGTLETS